MPTATVVTFEDAGHALFVDDPDRFNATLQKFLDSIPKK
jgi:pimeloyl-ACP methyl ester carboxylesterase